MDQLEFFRLVIGRLHPSGIGYMVVGSFASGFWGEPRATYDLDLVVAISEPGLARLLSLFPAEEFYVSPEAAADAVRRKAQFNLIHPDSGNKVDLVVRSDTPHAIEEFRRRRLLRVASGLDAYVASPEDVVIAKLRFHREGGSEKHLRDIAGILRTQGPQIDVAYVERWVGSIGLTEGWALVRASV